MAQETQTLGDVVASIAMYQRDGVAKARSLKFGTLHRTGNRLWISIPGHHLNTILAADCRKTAKALGFGDQSEVSMSVLAKDGKPVAGFGDAAEPETNSDTPKSEDDIPF